MTDPIFQNLHETRLVLLARQSETKRAYDTLRSQMAFYQDRLTWQPDVKTVLDTLQRKEHERTVGAYEQLLTALMQDVLPGPRELVMDLHTHGGVPALDLFIRKGSDPLEDALHGTGGSVTNILSAGLRAIALIRSGKRRFLVMDEADCWIKPQWAPRFAEVIQQLAVELNVQILMISHHSESIFPTIRHKLLLERGADGLHAQWSPSSEIPVWEDGQEGIRSITLEDFQSHKFTHISLSPGVTFLCGDNDIGKSAIVRALRCVFLGEGSKTVIRHHQKSTRVTIDFGPQHFLQWERFPKGKILETYRHYEGEKGPSDPIQAADGAKAVPDWLEPTFQIGLIDELDVQLRHQKEPIFLLDKPSTVRAKALAIGDDSGHVHAMLAIDKKETADARSSIKQGEKALERMSRVLLALNPVLASQDHWEGVKRQQNAFSERQSELEELTLLSARWSGSKQRQQALQALGQVAMPMIPKLMFKPELESLARQWRVSHQKFQALEAMTASRLPQAPTLKAPPLEALERRWAQADKTYQSLAPAVRRPLASLPQVSLSQDLVQLEARWRRSGARQVALALISPPFPPLPPRGRELGDLEELLTRWSSNTEKSHSSQQQLSQLRQEEEELRQHQALCPTCGQLWQPSA